jgi:hypothetical protein
MQGGSKQKNRDVNAKKHYLRPRHALPTSAANTERGLEKRGRQQGKKEIRHAERYGEAIGESIQALSELLGIRPPALQRPKLRKPGILKPKPGVFGGSAVRTTRQFNRALKPGAARPAAAPGGVPPVR